MEFLIFIFSFAFYVSRYSLKWISRFYMSSLIRDGKTPEFQNLFNTNWLLDCFSLNCDSFLIFFFDCASLLPALSRVYFGYYGCGPSAWIIVICSCFFWYFSMENCQKILLTAPLSFHVLEIAFLKRFVYYNYNYCKKYRTLILD